MLATVVFAQTGPTVTLLKVGGAVTGAAATKVAASERPTTDEAKHPDTRLVSLDREPAGRGGHRALEN